MTSAGEAFAYASREALDRIARAAEGLHLRQFRRLSVGVYGFFLSRFLLPMWPGLKAAHPELEIDLHTSANPVDLLASRYDAVIAVSDGQPRADLITRPMLPIATVPVCSPTLLKDGALDFMSVPLLHNRPRPDDWRRWLDHAQLTNVPVRGGSSFENLGLAIEAAAAELGAVIAIESLLDIDLAQLNLVRAHPIIRPTRRHFVLEYEQRMADDPAVAAFGTRLCSACKQPKTKKPTAKKATRKTRLTER